MSLVQFSNTLSGAAIGSLTILILNILSIRKFTRLNMTMIISKTSLVVSFVFAIIANGNINLNGIGMLFHGIGRALIAESLVFFCFELKRGTLIAKKELFISHIIRILSVLIIILKIVSWILSTIEIPIHSDLYYSILSFLVSIFNSVLIISLIRFIKELNENTNCLTNFTISFGIIGLQKIVCIAYLITSCFSNDRNLMVGISALETIILSSSVLFIQRSVVENVGSRPGSKSVSRNSLNLSRRNTGTRLKRSNTLPDMPVTVLPDMPAA